MVEIDIATKQLAIDKCPGPDGLSMNFIQKFYPDLKYLLHSIYLHADETNSMSGTILEGVIALMEKLQKDPLKTANWRPLVMLNCHYKIYAKIIANRLQVVLPYLISQDQVGFLKGRNIATNLTDLLTEIEYCEINRIDGIITFVDFEKAFDTIDWTAMQTIMRSFGFPDCFIKLVMLCYRGFGVRIANNGHFTGNIPIKRWNKQGCPLSALDFLLVVETVSLKLKQNNEIKPINIDGINKLLSQYADDLWTATKFDRKSFDAQIGVFEQFRKFTGLAINYNKTEVHRVGALAKTEAEIYSRYPLIWSDGPVRVLGLNITCNIAEIAQINYTASLHKIHSIYEHWSRRSMSLVGKVLVANVIAISQFLYKLQCLPSPGEKIVKEYEDMTRKFIWSCRKPKISLARLEASTEKGGLKLVNLKEKDRSLKIAKIFKLIAGPQSVTKKILCKIYNIPENLILECNLNVQDLTKVKGYQLQEDMYKIWCSINFKVPNARNEVLSQVLWHNSLIRVANKPYIATVKIMQSVQYFSDIYCEAQNRWYTIDEIKRKHPNTHYNFLHLSTLQAAIPKEWLKLLKIENTNYKTLFAKLEKQPYISKTIYAESINQRNRKDDKYLLKWEVLLDKEIVDSEWSRMTHDTNTLTLDTKLRAF